MTIVAGFPGRGVYLREEQKLEPDRGYVVLAADSEEGDESHKGNVRKIEELEFAGNSRCNIGGAGNSFFIDLAVQGARETLGACATLAEMRDALWTIVRDIYENRIDRQRQSTNDDVSGLDFELLCALWVKGEGAQMVYVHRGGTLIKTEPMSTGSGRHLASYLTAIAYYEGITLYEATRFAAYLLRQVKQHAQYCGGESQITWLDDAGRCQTIKPGSILLHEMTIDAVLREAVPTLLYKVDPLTHDWQFRTLAKELKGLTDGVLKRLRAMKKLLDRPPSDA